MGNLRTVTYPNGTVAEYTYDALNRLTYLENRTSGGTVISSYAYTLDAAGNRTKVVEHTGRTVEYTYDDTDKLLEEKITNPDSSVSIISYTYDAVGNRLTKRKTALRQRIRTMIITNWFKKTTSPTATTTTGI